VLRTIFTELRTIFACAANDFTVSHETNSLLGNKMYVVRLKKFSLQKLQFTELRNNCLFESEEALQDIYISELFTSMAKEFRSFVKFTALIK
jgi:hypothetical protein